MARKKWTARANATVDHLKMREKRKWQIALRRYVFEKNSSSFYAPYFGLDVARLKNWFEIQFHKGINWENFGKKWQFGHMLSLAYFDFSNSADLKLCWNFSNL